MPRHKRVTTCRKSSGPVSKHCSCEHCTLDVCAACGLWEGSLTTDCPNAKVEPDKQQEICETRLDYTDARGWHLAEPTSRRSPRFESKYSRTATVCCECGTYCPPDLDQMHEGCRRCGSKNVTAVEALPSPADPRALIAPSVDWTMIDRAADLQRELASKAIAWVLADRTCEEHSAALARIEDEFDTQIADGTALADIGGELLNRLDRAKIDFQLADQRAQRHDDEFRQTARRIVATLEETAASRLVTSLTNPYAMPHNALKEH
jgi:hypothetical protein